MARRCTCCDSDQRQGIDEALVAHVSLRTIAGRFGVSRTAVQRHQAHVSAALVAVQVRKERRGQETLTQRAERLLVKLEDAVDRAEASGHDRGLIEASREARASIELLAKLTGALDDRPQVAILSLIQSPDWIAVRTAVLAALRPFPEARVAVGEALRELAS